MRVIEIPVRPHIRQWLAAEYGTEPIARCTNLLGTVIINAYMGVNQSPRSVKCPGYVLIKVRLIDLLQHVSGNEMIAWEVSYLLEEHFTLAAISFINGWVSAGKAAFSAKEAFYQIYGIEEDDFSFDAFRKIWKDHQKRKVA